MQPTANSFANTAHHAAGAIADVRPAGIRFSGDVDAIRQDFVAHLQQLQLADCIATTMADGSISFALDEQHARNWVPQGDTTRLAQDLKLDLDRHQHDPEYHLAREIVVAMLAAPLAFDFPSYQEFAAALRIRSNIVHAAYRTQLAFHTDEVNRPDDCWTYSEDNGFTVIPGQALIPSLQKATQPDTSGRLYSFSCYRATEYVMLLGIAQELALSNPALLQQLQSRCETRAIMSGEFHEVFLHEYGSLEAPLPPAYYVPGDRLWFRNPDERSSDIAGYEGSWVIYLGGGLFCNFWKRDQPFTLASKCVEVFHWRDGAYVNEQGELEMNESIVEAQVHNTLNDPQKMAHILQQMLRLRDPQGVYASGGCIDASREYPRRVCPQSAEIVLSQR
jgi:hypothetical protein